MNQFTIQPLHDRVMVTPPEGPKPDEEKIIDGIVIPAGVNASTTAKIDNPHFVTEVLAAGEKCTLVKPGDKVVVRKAACFVVKVGETDHCTIREQDIVAVVKAE